MGLSAGVLSVAAVVVLDPCTRIVAAWPARWNAASGVCPGVTVVPDAHPIGMSLRVIIAKPIPRIFVALPPRITPFPPPFP